MGIVWFHHCGDVHWRGWRSSAKAIYQTWLQLLPLYDLFIQASLFLVHRIDLSRCSDGLCINDKRQLFIKVLKYASSLRNTHFAFGNAALHQTHCWWSAQFYPPHHYWASLAEPYSLLRIHLPPRTNINLGSHLEFMLPTLPRMRCQASPVTALAPC